MFSASLPRNILKFDLDHHLSLKDILRVCCHDEFTHKIEGKILDEDVKNVAEKPVTWWQYRTARRGAPNHCEKRGSHSEYVQTQTDNLTARQWRRMTVDVTKRDCA